jgi:predicted branched-subunit amino acid permease
VALSLGAAAIHLAAGPSHVEELGDLGLGFYWAALFQAAWAAAYAARSGTPRSSRSLAWIGIAGSLAISSAWVWSRTLGLPVGPEAWRPEAIGIPDAVATTFQVLLAGWLAWELAFVTRSSTPARRLRSGSAAMVAGVPIIGIVFLATTLAVAGVAAGHDHGGPQQGTAEHVTAAHSP